MSSMKMSLMLAVVMAMFTFSEASRRPKCRKSMVYKYCKFQYPETCNGDRPNVRMCFQGCNCKPGTVLLNEQTRNICVRKTECPAECAKTPDMVFTNCKPACYEVCDVSTGKRETRCQDERKCVRGCACRKGFGLNADGTCTVLTKSNCYGVKKLNRHDY